MTLITIPIETLPEHDRRMYESGKSAGMLHSVVQVEKLIRALEESRENEAFFQNLADGYRRIYGELASTVREVTRLSDVTAKTGVAT